MIPLSDVIPSRTKPVVTVGLIVVNAVVFLYQLMLPEPALQVFVGSYALIPAWFSVPALFTSQFLHGGWMHVISNMLYLWIFGDNVEDRLGHIPFLIFFFDLVEIPALFFLGIWFLMQLVNGLGSLGVANATGGGTAFWAHIGGFVVGVLVGAVLRKRDRRWEH